MQNNNELERENNHIKFWDSSLNDLIKQFEIITQFIDITIKYKSERSSDLIDIITKFRNDSKLFLNEPSHIYDLCEIFFIFQSTIWGLINESSNELFNKIKLMNVDFIKDLKSEKKEICKKNLEIIDKCQKLINKIKSQDNDFQKIKSSMDDAQKNQKKIKNKAQYTYNVGEKKKADLQLAEQIRKMEEIKIPMEKNKKDLFQLKTELSSITKESFDKYIIIYFKYIANLHQLFFLLGNNKLEVVSSLKKQLNIVISKLSNLSFDLNDYTEKKYGELIGIKFDGILMIDSELLNKSSSKLLLKISYDIINYTQVFMICLRYRKKIMKLFLEVIKSLVRCEDNYKKNYNNSYKNLMNQINSIKNITEETLKNWSNIFLSEKAKSYNEYSSILSGVDTFINLSRNEYNKFNLDWNKYELKIKEGQKILIEFLKEKNDTKKEQKEINKNKDEKFREIIKESIIFINNNVYDIRERNKKEISKLSSIFEKLFFKYKNIINKIIDSTEEEIISSVSLDLFDQCKTVIIKYFKSLKIPNYENYLEKIRKKLLRIQLQNNLMSKELIEKLNYKYIESNINTPSKNNFDDSQSKSLFEDNITDDKKLNLLSPKKESMDSLNINNFNIDNNIRNIKSNFEIDNKKEISKNNEIEEEEENNEEDVSLNLLDKNKFQELTKIENPYTNINEEELNRLKSININSAKKENDLEEGEIKIDSFNCALKDKILLQGFLYITTKKIEFKSLFNPVTLFGKTTIKIPLKDIIDIEKKYYLALDNSIQVKTKKVNYLFINFLSRDKCFNLLENQLNQAKERNEKSKINEIISKNNLDNKGLQQRRLKIKQILKMLEENNFNLRQKQITKERMELFAKKYRDGKKGIFLPNEQFSKKLMEHVFNSCPLFICFKYICNPATQLDEMGHSKGFFESILMDNICSKIEIIEKDENINIPDYFNNEEYVMDLFASFDENKLDNLINEAQNWPHKYEYICCFLNENKKEDLYAIYFISPTLLILDIVCYSIGLKFYNNYIPIFRFRFDFSVKLNKNQGRFNFITKMTVLFGAKFLSYSVIKDLNSINILDECHKIYYNKVLNKLINIIENYSQIFNDIYEKKFQEKLPRNINIKGEETFLEEEYKKESYDELSEENDIIINDINFINEINNINLKNEKNNIDIDYINISDITDLDKYIKDKKFENEKSDNKTNNKLNNINEEKNNNINEQKSKKIDKQYIILIIIILMLIGIIISLLFNRAEKKNQIDYNLIINFIILSAVIYLLLNK